MASLTAIRVITATTASQVVAPQLLDRSASYIFSVYSKVTASTNQITLDYDPTNRPPITIDSSLMLSPTLSSGRLSSRSLSPITPSQAAAELSQNVTPAVASNTGGSSNRIDRQDKGKGRELPIGLEMRDSTMRDIDVNEPESESEVETSLETAVIAEPQQKPRRALDSVYLSSKKSVGAFLDNWGK